MAIYYDNKLNYTPLSSSAFSRRRRPNNRKWRLLLIFLCMIGTGIVMLKTIVNRAPKSNAVVKGIETSPQKSLIDSLVGKKTGMSLGEVVEKELIDAKGSYGIAIKNLKTGESYVYNDHKKFEAASLYKLWVMATAYDKIANGALKEDEQLEDEVEKINETFDIATEEAELTEGTVSFSVKDALKQMITISHNYAALLLAKRIGLSQVNTFLQDHGFAESAVGQPPKTTPSDISLFLEKLYKGELGTEESTGKMLDLLAQQQLNEKLPKYLPADTLVAHKTGELGGYSHDAGIVYSPKGDYIIVVMSQSDYPPGAEEHIAAISQAVYDYFDR